MHIVIATNCIAEAVLGRLPTLTFQDVTLFSVSAALCYLLPVPKEMEIFNDRWLEWEISQLQVLLYIESSYQL